ncbi:unnamed protein product, partial [Discosporangium mesarthrocarpum]
REKEALLEAGNVDTSNILTGPRRRGQVNYIKLNQDLFGDGYDTDSDGGYFGDISGGRNASTAERPKKKRRSGRVQEPPSRGGGGGAGAGDKHQCDCAVKSPTPAKATPPQATTMTTTTTTTTASSPGDTAPDVVKGEEGGGGAGGRGENPSPSAGDNAMAAADPAAGSGPQTLNGGWVANSVHHHVCVKVDNEAQNGNRSGSRRQQSPLTMHSSIPHRPSGSGAGSPRKAEPPPSPPTPGSSGVECGEGRDRKHSHSEEEEGGKDSLTIVGTPCSSLSAPNEGAVQCSPVREGEGEVASLPPKKQCLEQPPVPKGSAPLGAWGGSGGKTGVAGVVVVPSGVAETLAIGAAAKPSEAAVGG